MSRTSRNLILILLVLVGLGGRALAADATITVSGAETQVSGSWDTGTMTIAFGDSAGHAYSETIVYGQFSTSASIASSFGAAFSNTYINSGVLCAHATGGVIYFHLSGTVTFSLPTITNPSVSFSVVKTSWQVAPILSWTTPAAITYGTALTTTQLDATASAPGVTGTLAALPGTFTYTPALSTLLNGGSQTISAAFAPTDSADYRAAITTVTLLVNPATPTLTVVASTATPNYGSALTFTATISSGASGTVDFYDAGTLIGSGTISSNSTTLITSMLPSGSHTITANWPGNSNYAPITSSAVTVTVGQGIALLGPGIINTVAGIGSCNNIYSQPPGGTLATSNEVCDPAGIAVDSAGNVYFTNSLNSVVQMVAASTGYITTVAGNGQQDGSVGPGDGGPATQAELFTPIGVAVDPSGNIFIADSGTNRIREVAAQTTNGLTQGYIYTVAGNGQPYFPSQQGGSALTAGLSPNGVAVDKFGNLYIPDRFDDIVQKVTFSNGVGTISTVAGGGTVCSGNSDSWGDGCPATSATLNAPVEVAVDSNLNLYIVDAGDKVIREVSASTGIISAVAGAGPGGTVCSTQLDSLGDGCIASSAQLGGQGYGVAVDLSGNIYISDTGSNLIREVSASSGTINRFAGNGNGVDGYTGDGGSATLAELSTPTQIAVDANGSVYFPDGYRIRAVGSPASIIKSTPTVSWTAPAAIPYGTTLGSSQLNASSALAGTYLYSPTAGTMPVAGQNTLSVTFAPTNATFYNPAFATTTVTVNPGQPVITWATPPPISYGTALSTTQLNATATVAGAFVYTPSTGTVLGVGTQTLSATFTPSDTLHYSTVTTTVSLQVFQAAPVITWALPASVAKGTALSATQLNATASVAGSFSYTPSSGTLLNTEGPQVLTAVFSPANTTDYTTATATAYLTVTQDLGTWDTGTVTLAINNSVVATAPYGQLSTPASVAEGLAQVASSSLVNVTAVDDALYIEAVTPGLGSNSISYTIANGSYASTYFAQPSFPSSSISGNLEGGANSSSNNGTTVYSYNVPTGGYDGVGNLLNYTDSTVMGAWSFQYDHLNRLSLATQTPLTGMTQAFCWTYDAFGNRTAQDNMQSTLSLPFTNAPGASPCLPASGSTQGPDISETFSAANNNQITNTNARGTTVTPVYDAAGNITNDGLNQYLYDGDGRICAVASTPIAGLTTMTGYLYGADGTRVSKGTITQWSCDPGTSGFTPTNDYVLGLGGEQVTEMAMGSAVSGTTSSAMAWLHTNVYAAGKLIATYDGLDKTSGGSTGGLHFYLDDPLGTRRVQTDYAGVVEQTCQSWPFGDQLACSGSTQYPTEHHFTGKERDTESGNDYFGARYYSSAMGRFMSPDWAVKATPVPYAVLDNPQSLNLYSYVQNNPLSRTDPTGHDWFYYNKQWQWQKGHTFYNKDGAVKGLKGYEYLLVFQKTGTSAAGAATGTLTLYDQKSVAFQGNAVSTGFSGGNTPDGYKPPIPNGGYTINLANRGSVTDGYNSPALPAHFDGLQTLHDSSGVDQSGNSWSASYTYEWGNIRAHLDPLQGGLPFDAYLHGKSRTEGGDYTHGCIAERSEVILHMLQGLTVQSLGVDVK